MSLLREMTRLYALLPPSSRRQAWILIVLMLLNACSEVSGVAGMLPFAAVASDPGLIQSQPLLHQVYLVAGQPDPRQFLIYLGAGFLVLLVAMNLLNALTFWYSLKFSFDFGCRLSARLLGSYLARPYLWFLQRNNTDLCNLVLTEVDAFSEVIVLSAAELFTMVFVAVFLVAGLLWIDPVVAVTTTSLLAVLYSQIYRSSRNHLDTVGVNRLQSSTARHRAADDALKAVKEARAFPQAGLFLCEFQERARRYSHYRILERLVAELPKYGTEVLAVASLGLILLYLVFRGHASQHAIPLVCLYIMATWRLVPALQTIYRNGVRICFHAPLMTQLQRELEDGPGLPEEESDRRLPLHHSLKLEAASFTYPGQSQPAFCEVSLEIPRGSVVALVGRTGSGKSTLAEVLAGLLPLSAGSLTIDDQALKDENRMDWLRNVGYVPQNIFLVDDTLTRNVALGYPLDRIDQTAVEQAVHTACLSDFVERELPQAYQTRLGERGISLSGGQRQRVGIARALYHNPELLILDEATSALDNLTELEVMEAISALAGKKTLVLIAHRLTTVQLCRQVVLMEKGRLVASGTYQELLETSLEFARLACTELVTPNPS